MRIDRIDANNPKTPYPISENLLMEPIGAKGPKLGWHRPADALVPAAYYLRDISKGRLDVRSDYDGREVKTLYRLRCTNKLLKISAQIYGWRLLLLSNVACWHETDLSV